MNSIWKFALSFVFPLLAGGIGGIFTSKTVEGWYRELEKPPFNPPGWVFGPVWTALYLFMGYSLFLVWSKENATGKKLALVVFGVQLILNVLWSAVFFGAEQLGWALFVILFLWLAILGTIILFYPISKTAAWLLVPYLAWVTYAGILNWQIWRLN